MNGDNLVPGPPVTDKRAITLAIILFLLCLVAMVGNGFITAALGMEWLLWRMLSPCHVIGQPVGLLLLSMVGVPSLPVGLFERCHLMVLHLVQCLLLCENCNLHPPCLPLNKAEGVWVGSMDAAQLHGVLHLEHHPIFHRQPELFKERSAILECYQESYKEITGEIPLLPFKTCYLGSSYCCLPHWHSFVHHIPKKTHQEGLPDCLRLLPSQCPGTHKGIFPSQEFRYCVWQAVIYLCSAVHPTIILLSNTKLRVVLERGCSSRRGAS
ncbi:hypothetical protein HPG69_016392 [Diceros bicornis minor]|uniref:Uncharacterized protein n=1 Tax=Diceros bicornis minor TaxID=77932 RepID=A0A7J7EFI5_DICBM|nr:hypothetical protein HPG69_016392 [Diceros bicornis minor]